MAKPFFSSTKSRLSMYPLSSGDRQRTFVGTRTHVSPPSSVLYKGRGAPCTAENSAFDPAINHPWLASTKSKTSSGGASAGVLRTTQVIPPSEVTRNISGPGPLEVQQYAMPCWRSQNVGELTEHPAARAMGSRWKGCDTPCQ